ncbi:putative glycosidase crf1 [Cladobotryum mycophilum]|uniref:Glycosidase crf1 n=1 Tax=Cladobotryum mycophilum TaxID=491253 RepID=A0ABR0STS8_9HYPO
MLCHLFLSLALAIPVLASLEDLTHCDPLKKDTRCPPDPAFAGKASFDFSTADWNTQLSDFWAADAGTSKDHDHINFETDGKGAAVSVWGDGQAPTLTSNKYFLFGKVSVEAQAAQGPGLITAIVLKSDSGDEIDWELLGAYDNQAQTNYFYDGQALFNTYNDTYPLDTPSFAAYHRYSVEWTPERLTFAINGTDRKTWLVGDIPAAKWPQTPMQVKLGVWSVGNASDPGEIAWAGGVPDWEGGKDRPRTAYFKSLEVDDYAGLCNQTDGPVEYLYNERTRGWSEVQIRGCVKRVFPGLPDITGSPGQPTQTGREPSGTASPTNSNDTQPTQTGEEPPSETDDEGAAQLAKQLSSPLAAVVLLCWILMI